MPISVQRPGAPSGSFLTNMLSLFNTGHNTYRALTEKQMGAAGGDGASGAAGAGADAASGSSAADAGTVWAGPDAAATDATAAEGGGAATDAIFAYRGGIVPGHAYFKGNSPGNDTVSARISPGEMVVPRTAVKGGPKAVENFAMDAMKRRMGKG